MTIAHIFKKWVILIRKRHKWRSEDEIWKRRSIKWRYWISVRNVFMWLFRWFRRLADWWLTGWQPNCLNDCPPDWPTELTDSPTVGTDWLHSLQKDGRGDLSASCTQDFSAIIPFMALCVKEFGASPTNGLRVTFWAFRGSLIWGAFSHAVGFRRHFILPYRMAELPFEYGRNDAF